MRVMIRMANVQIPADLFKELYEFVWENAPNSDLMRQMNDKLDRLIERELFTKYKRAATTAERERYRNEYLDHKGIMRDFRTETEVPKENL